jgi:hypothetical protein
MGNEEMAQHEEDTLIRPLLNHEDAKRCKAISNSKDWRNPSRVKPKVRLCALGECKLFSDGDARFNK